MRFSVISEIPGRTRLQLAGPVPEGDLDALIKLSTNSRASRKSGYMAVSGRRRSSTTPLAVRTGGKPIALGACCWVAIACVSLGMQHVIGIW